MFLVLWRIWISPVAIFIADNSLTIVDHYFTLIVPRDVSGNINCLSLCIRHSCNTRILFPSNRPVAFMRNYVLIFSGHILSPPFKKISLDIELLIEDNLLIENILIIFFTKLTINNSTAIMTNCQVHF